MPASNSDVARVLRELALLTSLEEGSPQAFRARAYENAAQSVGDAGRDVGEMTDGELTSLKGVGKSTAQKIRQYLDTGSFPKLDELRAKYPPDFLVLARIPGLGPKTLVLLRDVLGVNNLDDLRRAIDAEALRELPGLGQKSEEKIRTAIERLGLHTEEARTPISRALPIAGQIIERLAEMDEVKEIAYAGSLRRFRESIGDIDIIVASQKPAAIMNEFTSLRIVDDVLSYGDTKSSIVTREGLQIDLRVVTPGQYGAAMVYFTGSKAHNIALRQRALAKGWTLNEYALSDIETEKVIAARTEAAVYRKLGLESIPPPLREDGGEIEAAAERSLPRLVEESDLKGDLHVHSSLSGDGRAGLDRMVAAAAERGLSYLAITDHGEDLVINGASRDQMRRQRKRLAKLQEDYPDLRLLHGCELNIGPDGGLDYDDSFLMEFDWCIASVHSQFDLDVDRQTNRIVTAMRHPAVNAIGHLTGRKLGRRPGIELDIDQVLDAALDTGTGLEVNGAIDRLDAPAGVIREGGRRGVRFVIDTDAHHPDEYRRAAWGVLNAQRGWLQRSAVANTWPIKKFLSWADSKRNG